MLLFIDNDLEITLRNLRTPDGTIVEDQEFVVDIGVYVSPSPVITNVILTEGQPYKIVKPTHGLTSGDLILVTRIDGVLQANGAYTITVTDANSFTLNGTVYDPEQGVWLLGGTYYKGVIGATNIDFVNQGEGTYRAMIEAGVPFKADTQYLVVIYSTDYRAKWEIPSYARIRA